MKRLFKNISIGALIVLMVVSSILCLPVVAAEDTTAPELIWVEVKPSSINSGDTIEVHVKVKETGTGLVQAFVQFNHTDDGSVMAFDTFSFDQPLYSSKNHDIEYVFSISTRSNARGGDWVLGYLEFTDQKGNWSRYCGKQDRNEIALDGQQQGFAAKTHVMVTNTGGDVTQPRIHTISVKTPIVEKSKTLELEATISEAQCIHGVQINLTNGKDEYIHQEGYIESVDANGHYLIQIPISTDRHLGTWEITDIRFADDTGNQVHYTNQTVQDYFVEYSGLYPEKFSPLTFTVTGLAGDETAPVVTNITVLNDALTVSKPGILKLKLDIVEDGTGVTFLDIMYEIPTNLNNPVDGSAVTNSRSSCRFMLKGTEEYYTDTPTVTLDAPLKTGSHVLEVPVSSVRPNGAYIVYVYALKDQAGNETAYHSERKPRATFSVTDEFEYAFEMGITNGSLRAAVKNLKDGEVGRILLSDKPEQNVLTKQVLNDIAGRDKTLVCYRDGYQWILNGKDIEHSKTKDLNLTARIFTITGENLSSGKAAIGISFENNGKLPGKVEFRFKTAFVNNYFGKEDALRLYHVENTEGGYETDIDYTKSDYEQIPSKDANIQVMWEEQDAWCYIDLTHNSKYVLSDSKLVKLSKKTIGTSNATSSANEDMQSTAPHTQVTSTNTPATSPKPQGRGGLIAVIAAAVIVIAGGVCLAFTKKGKDLLNTLLKK